MIRCSAFVRTNAPVKCCFLTAQNWTVPGAKGFAQKAVSPDEQSSDDACDLICGSLCIFQGQPAVYRGDPHNNGFSTPNRLTYHNPDTNGSVSNDRHIDQCGIAERDRNSTQVAMTCDFSYVKPPAQPKQHFEFPHYQFAFRSGVGGDRLIKRNIVGPGIPAPFALSNCLPLPRHEQEAFRPAWASWFRP